VSATTRGQQEGSERFVREINRALVARGKLDAVMQAISDHWTLVLQRLFPVWCVVGPGLADPGHIELTSRTVYLDSALLGTREEITSGRLEPRRILATFGVGIHEVLHAKCTRGWVMDRDLSLSASDDEKLRQLAVDRRLLEEPRMEANGIREFPADSKRGRFVRQALGAAVVDLILPRLSEAIMIEALATGAVSRDLCGRTMVYAARTHYGVLDPARLGPLPAIWKQVLGADDVLRLDDLLARLIWVPDGDNDELDRHAALYRDVIGPPPHPPPSAGEHARGTRGPRDEASAAGQCSSSGDASNRAAEASKTAGADGEAGGQDRDNSTDGHATGVAADSGVGKADGQNGAGDTPPPPQSLSDALEQAMAEQRDGQLEQLNEDIDLQKLLKDATTRTPPRKGTRGTGRPSGRLPDRGVNRPPFPDEVQMARQFARRLHQAREIGQKRLGKQTPGGRFNPRGYMRARGQRSLGVPVTATSWELTKTTRAPIREPHVGLVIDTSASMRVWEGSLGPIAWILSEGLREIGGRLAIALFGNGAELLSDGSRPLPIVPGIRTGGGTAFASDAVCLTAEYLELENPSRPRWIFCLSDGAWSDTESGVKRIRELQDGGVPVVHIAIGAFPPLSVEASRVVLVSDPADALDLIAYETVEALKARRRR
jgi:hypothetical protein